MKRSSHTKHQATTCTKHYKHNDQLQAAATQLY